MVGPFGVARPLAGFDLIDREKEKVAFWVDEGLLEELGVVFKENARSAMRHAARLGALACNPEIAVVRGKVIGLGRPLVDVNLAAIEDRRAVEALARLKQK